MRAMLAAALVCCATQARATDEVGPTQALSLHEAITTALSNHPELERARMAAEMSELDADVALRPFDSELRLQVEAGHHRTPSAEAPSGVLSGPAITGMTGFARRFSPGTRWELELHHETSSAAGSVVDLLQPRHFTWVETSLVQPLWRGRGAQVTLAPQAAARAEASSRRHELRRLEELVAARVAVAYWTLAFAQSEAEVRSRALELSVRFSELTGKLVAAGAATDAELSAAAAAQALRLAQWRSAQRNIETARLELAQSLMLAPGAPLPAAAESLPAVERPSEGVATHEAGNTGATRKTARAGDTGDSRADLAALEALARASEERARALEDEARPTVDVGVTAALSGLGGTASTNACAFYPNDAFRPAACVPGSPLTGGLGSDLKGLATGGYYFAGVTLDVQIPLENRAAAAEAERANLEVRRRRNEVEALRRQSAHELAVLERAVEIDRQRAAEAQRAFELTQKVVEMETLRFSRGSSTALDVLRVQEQLAEASLLEAQARMSAAVTGLKAALARGRTLEHLGVSTPTSTSARAR